MQEVAKNGGRNTASCKKNSLCVIFNTHLGNREGLFTIALRLAVISHDVIVIPSTLRDPNPGRHWQNH